MPVRKVVIDRANRLYQMPPDIMAFATAGSRKLFPRKSELVDLGNFRWPIEPTGEQVPTPEDLRPAGDDDLASLREELADWLHRHRGIRLIKEKELFIGGRTSSLVYQLAMAFIDPGDVAFVPSVGLPLYRSAVMASDGEPVGYEISSKTDWQPRFDRLSTGLGRVARILFLNSPHNPTGARVSEKEMAELAWLAGRENVLLVNDATYAGMLEDSAVSLLSSAAGKRVGVELASFSYTFGLPRFPFGFVYGNREVINGLKHVARLMPPYLPRYYVRLALDGIRRYPNQPLDEVRKQISAAQADAGRLVDRLGLTAGAASSVPYLWARIPKRTPSTSLARSILRRYHTLVAPGLGFGENGEGFLRFSLLAGPEAFAETIMRVERRRTSRRRRTK